MSESLRAIRVVAVAALLCLISACGDGSKQAASSPKPSPTPTLPTVAADKAAVKAAVVTAVELGPGWVQPKAVNRIKGAQTKGKAFLCPGHETAYSVVTPRATDGASLTLGSKAGADIASFNVILYLPTQVDAWRLALATAQSGCRQWRAAEGNYDVLTPVEGVTVSGAEETVAFLESVYADAAHKHLQYVRQVVNARVGRLVCFIERAFLVPKTNPTGKDFAETTRLLQIQFKKAVGDVIQ